MIAAFAETNRVPFDLPEAENELVAGFHTEYSSMKFAMFFMGEYAAMLGVSGIATTLWFGGWLPPIPQLGFIPSGIWFLFKMFVFFFGYVWLRATLPRLRYDALMAIGWKRMLPVSLVRRTSWQSSWNTRWWAEWRRRESNPRPRTHRCERLQA